MTKKTAKVDPLAEIPNGTQQIYFDSTRGASGVWLCREMQQRDPDNPRSRKRWVDIDLAVEQARLVARHPNAAVMSYGR